MELGALAFSVSSLVEVEVTWTSLGVCTHPATIAIVMCISSTRIYHADECCQEPFVNPVLHYSLTLILVVCIVIMVALAGHLSTVRKSREIYNVIQFKY